nr:MAG TPA: hypothetical protein [Bacteriophage sp.]
MNILSSRKRKWLKSIYFGLMNSFSNSLIASITFKCCSRSF